MEVIITGSAFNTGASMQRHIKEKLDSVSKKFKPSNVRKLHLVLNKDGINFLCRIDVVEEIGKKSIIHASSEAVEAYVCVDLAIKKIEEQIIKHKERMIRSRNHSGAVFKSEMQNGHPEEIIVDPLYEIIGDEEDVMQN